jgi:uncharacterized protein YfaS (alpha-2-macroglobulin family)
MRFRPLLYSILLMPLVTTALHAQTDDAPANPPLAPGILHVLRPVLHSDQDQAELCLEFDRALDTSNHGDAGDHGKAQLALKLDSGGKPVPVAAVNETLTAESFCLTNLDHRRPYRLTLTNIRGSQDEKLAEPYHLTFILPDRQPALSFVQPPNADGFMRWQDNDPVLRSLNLAKAQIEIYQVTDTGSLTDAWRQRDQLILAPSESAYFARHNGKLLWQGELALPDAPNQTGEQKIPARVLLSSLSGGALNTLPHGLFLILASAPEIKTPKAHTGLAPLAAMWLLHSDLKLQALRGVDGYYALTEKADATSPLKDVKLTLEDNSRQSLTEGLSDDSGITLLPLPDEKRNQAVTLIGVTSAGDVAFADLSNNAATVLQGIQTAASAPDASLSTDKHFYPPASTVVATLTARSDANHPNVLTDTQLQIIKPDGSLYASMPVPVNADGIARLSFPAPVENGLWSLIWQPTGAAAKTFLAKTPLRITSNDDAPVLSLTNDQPMLDEDGTVTLSLKSITASGKPAPYLPGHITVTWVAATQLFPGWDGYSFGYQDDVTAHDAAHIVAGFITDADGVAHLHVILPIENSASGATLAARLAAVTDRSSGALDPAPVTIPAKPKNLIIGIKPATADHKFAENSVAHFNLIALNADGKRRDADNLIWQIFEIGRSFDWRQAQGSWDYQLQQQERRLKTGAVNLKTTEDAGIDWPVTAGNYRLEISDASGSKLAALDFTAGWEHHKQDISFAPLVLTPVTASLQKNVEAQIKFRLDQPAPDGFMLNAVIADNRIRKIIHEVRKQGDATIRFTPEAGWVNPVSVWVETETLHPGNDPTLAAGHITLAFAASLKVDDPKTDVKNNAVAATSAAPLSITGSVPALLKTGDSVTVALTVTNNASPASAFHYAITSPVGLKTIGNLNGTLNLAPGQSRSIIVTLNAVEAGTQDIAIDITGPRGVHFNQGWTLGVTLPVKVVSGQNLITEILAPQQARNTTAPAIAKDTGETNFIAPQPLYDLPLILADALRSPSFTSREMADELDMLRLWHDVIVASGLLPDPRIAAREQALRLRLLTRQNADGGFPLLPGTQADIATTASALTSLAPFTAVDQDPTDHLLVQTAVDQAAGWLKHRLDNNWFDESERPERAAAYAALALAGKLDTASLNYFADTSADKHLPVKAAAQLALAFDKSNDGAKDAYWLNVAHLTPTPASIDADILPLLAFNTAFDERTLLPALEKLSASLTSKTAGQNPGQGFDPAQAMDFLRALWHVENRAGAWRIAIDNGEQSLHNVLVLSRRPHGAAFNLRNPNDRPLYLTSFYPVATSSVQATRALSDTATLSRRIYRMNGMEVLTGENLNSGQTYLVVLEGPAHGDILLHDNPAPALRPVSCGIDGELNMNDTAAWIGTLNLTPITLCEKNGNAIDLMLRAGTASDFRGAYLAKAEWRGSFSLAPASARQTGAAISELQIQQSRPQRLRVE